MLRLDLKQKRKTVMMIREETMARANMVREAEKESMGVSSGAPS